MHGLHFEDARLTFEGQIDESELEEFFRLVWDDHWPPYSC